MIFRESPNSSYPLFFSTAKEKEVLLLTHPVLENEVLKHIENSGLYKDFNSLGNCLRKCGETLNYLDCFNEELFSKINNIDIRTKLFDSFKQHYSDAVQLEYGDPATVFFQYFNGKAPFSSTGDKKHEFPDAFVIDATKKYLAEHPNDILLFELNSFVMDTNDENSFKAESPRAFRLTEICY